MDTGLHSGYEVVDSLQDRYTSHSSREDLDNANAETHHLWAQASHEDNIEEDQNEVMSLDPNAGDVDLSSINETEDLHQHHNSSEQTTTTSSNESMPISSDNNMPPYSSNSPPLSSLVMAPSSVSFREGNLWVVNVGHVSLASFNTIALKQNVWAFVSTNERSRIKVGDFVLFVTCLVKVNENQTQGFNRKAAECYGRSKAIYLVRVKDLSDNCSLFPQRETKKNRVEVLRYSFDFDLIIHQNAYPFIDFTFENYGKAVLEARRKSDIGGGSAHLALVDDEYVERLVAGRSPFFDPNRLPRIEENASDILQNDSEKNPSKRRRNTTCSCSKKAKETPEGEYANLNRLIKIHCSFTDDKECIRVSLGSVQSVEDLVKLIRTSFKIEPDIELKLKYLDAELDSILILEDRTTLDELKRFASSIHVQAVPKQ